MLVNNSLKLLNRFDFTSLLNILFSFFIFFTSSNQLRCQFPSYTINKNIKK